MKTPKQRVTAPDGKLFYNNFSNVFFMDNGTDPMPLVLNLPNTNWTISDRSEAAFLINDAGDAPQLVVIDTVNRRRTFQQQPMEQFRILDLVMSQSVFYAAVPGMLIAGKRGEKGELVWKGIKAIDRGVGYRMQLADDGRLLYSRKGNCNTFTFDPVSRKTDACRSFELIWEAVFSQAFLSGYMPPLPRKQTYESIKETLYSAAAEGRKLSDAGFRLFALLSHMEQSGFAGLDALTDSIAYDWSLQCNALENEPYPSRKLLQEYLKKGPERPVIPERPGHVKVIRWCRVFELKKPSSRIKILDEVVFEDIHIK